ncbi:serine O-acetyltransferase EpsC [Lutimonas zeaxanthinifaciens]|uniref:serine O-acetyltransferase EpsC n=1 Tax=Lutimonas zeaxanthinifaciens TaxID=3060215 RepID=UPI00265CE512|nr:serine O-acetyltransferase EpsC [Lutimonas sp. YSD2104]WKK65412.1 serine O-acetyltransferase EpsC [Lutimonas sp. YSD2104]
MSIDKIIQSIRSNKQNHLVDFRVKSKTEEFTESLFKILFDSKISVSNNMEELGESFKAIACMIDKGDQSRFELVWKKFLVNLPELLNQLNQDAKCIFLHDPASRSIEEVILAYPGFYAIAVYRLSHELHLQNMPLIPRIMSEYAHRLTGIDIHPGAEIGSPFFIDHGTGVVIGESTIIKNKVKVYQGVTLGALQVSKDMKNIKRHPTVEDNVTIYAGATILGGDTIIGKNSTIGGNVWLTESVPENSIVYQRTDIKLKKKTNHAES